LYFSSYCFSIRESAKLLEVESGSELQLPNINALFSNILSSNWEACLSLLSEIKLPRGKADDAALRINVRKYIELLEKRRIPCAIELLRSSLLHLESNQDR